VQVTVVFPSGNVCGEVMTVAFSPAQLTAGFGSQLSVAVTVKLTVPPPPGTVIFAGH
jgi:hypothetical protein